MSFENLPKGSVLYIEAKDPLCITTYSPAKFAYPGATANSSTAGGQDYNATVATRNILLPADKDVLKFRRVSEHNRSEFSVGTNRIKQSSRMANGTLREFIVADKKIFSLSWSMLPSYRNETVDGAWGAEDLKTFYESLAGKKSFRIKVNTSTSASAAELSTDNIYTVVFTEFNCTLYKRGIQPYWSVSCSLEQV
jgi:hypothetical protein